MLRKDKADVTLWLSIICLQNIIFLLDEFDGYKRGVYHSKNSIEQSTQLSISPLCSGNFQKEN